MRYERFDLETSSPLPERRNIWQTVVHIGTDLRAETALVWSLRYFDMVAPAVVVRWAEQWAAREEGVGAVIDLAMMSDPLADDLDRALDSLTEQVGLPPISTEDAIRVVSVGVARRLECGETTPYESARELWDLADLSPVTWPELSPFVFYASEWEDDITHRAAYEQGIREACSHLLDAAGSHPTPTTDEGPTP